MTVKEMRAALKKDGKWIVSAESTGRKDKHSYWCIYWNDSDDCEHVRTDGTDGGSTKAWQKTLAMEKAIISRYKRDVMPVQMQQINHELLNMPAKEGNSDKNQQSKGR